MKAIKAESLRQMEEYKAMQRASPVKSRSRSPDSRDSGTPPERRPELAEALEATETNHRAMTLTCSGWQVAEVKRERQQEEVEATKETLLRQLDEIKVEHDNELLSLQAMPIATSSSIMTLITSMLQGHIDVKVATQVKEAVLEASSQNGSTHNTVAMDMIQVCGHSALRPKLGL